MGKARISAYSFNNQLDILLGPSALPAFKVDSSLETLSSETVRYFGDSSKGRCNRGDVLWYTCKGSNSLKTDLRFAALKFAGGD